MQVIGNPVRSHRTALVIDVSKSGSKGDFQERYNRLLQSVNGANIKVDVYTFDGVTLRPGAPDAADGVEADSTSSLEEFAAKLGYSQLLVDRAV